MQNGLRQGALPCGNGGISTAFTKNSSNDGKTKNSGPAVYGTEACGARRAQVERLLRRALRENLFEIYYQPLYDIQSEKFTEAEALLRLRDAQGRFVPPDEFIPVAEQAGLICDIGSLVLGSACRSMGGLLAAGADIESVSVNLSALQLRGPESPEQLLGVIRRSGVPPERIVLEVTESTFVRDYSLIADRIREISGAGVRFALDDFGTGYSSIAHVTDLPFDSVKIDKSLIWNSVTNRRCKIMTCDLTRMFKEINLCVTAEGVETPEHDAFVRLCGCDKIQGFRYAKPMPIGQAAGFFSRVRA